MHTETWQAILRPRSSIDETSQLHLASQKLRRRDSFVNLQPLEPQANEDAERTPTIDSAESDTSGFGRTISAPEIGLRRRFLEEQAKAEEIELIAHMHPPSKKRLSTHDSPGTIEPSAAWLTARAASKDLIVHVDQAGASEDILRAVVDQLDSPEASAAAAAVEYLVSSSDPKGSAPESLRGWRWTSEGAKVNRTTLGSFPGLWDCILKQLLGSSPEAHAKVCGAMSKLGFRNTNNVLAMIKHNGMLSALTHLLSDDHSAKVQVQAWRVLQNCVSGIDEVKVILCQETQLLEAMKDACAMEERPPEIRMRAVSVIMHASSSDAAKSHLLQARIPEEALQAVMASDAKTMQASATRIRATLASANLCGREERSILSTTPEMLSEIVRCVQHAMEETEYCGIKWSLAGVMLPLFNLSCSDSNKMELIRFGTVALLLKLVEELANSTAQASTSSEPFELALRTLANFTFNEDAKEQMLQQNTLQIMDAVIERLQGETIPARKVAQDLAFMLSDTGEHVTRDSNELDSRCEQETARIMISYSWAEKKQNVVALTGMLREKGYDVWRDEDGSRLVQKMMGSSMEIMAQAIEVANFVIVFVSRAYRDSYNCKLEGKYAQTRERAGLVKILFVMMEEDYTPQSEAGVDGWLGMMIADSIWYTGWDADMLMETVDMLEKVIEKSLADDPSRVPPASLSRSVSTAIGSEFCRVPSSARNPPANTQSLTRNKALISLGLSTVMEGNQLAQLQAQQEEEASGSVDPNDPSSLSLVDPSAGAQSLNSITPHGHMAQNLGVSSRSLDTGVRRTSLYAVDIGRTGSGGPPSEVDDWLWRKNLQELAALLQYHKIDSLWLVAKLSDAHICRITDRVGLQVRLMDAVEELKGAGTNPPPAYARVAGSSGTGDGPSPQAGQLLRKRSGSPRNYLLGE